MAKFDSNNPFTLTNWKDPVDLVLSTDSDIAEVEEKCKNNIDENPSGDDISLVNALKESGVISYDCDVDELDGEYNDEYDDDADFVSLDASMFIDAKSNDIECEELDEEDMIDSVIAGDIEDLENE